MAPSCARRCVRLAAVGLLVSAAAARAEDQPPGFAVPEEQPVLAELIAEHASIQPGGMTRIGVHFELEEGWHIYAEDPGDAGLPTQIAWSVPHDVSVSELHWPPHHEFLDPGDIRTFGYSGTVVLYSTLTCAPGAGVPVPVTEIPIQASIKWLACKAVCIPGSVELELALPVSSNPPVFSTHAQLFEHTD